ncbi:hypothetical protein PM082_002351 [Marasmius tenuissimus]|nr:hypothetical protein PM082_002351 [Marasmius tenuissimus]
MGPKNIEEAVAPYISVQNVIVKPIATLSALFIVYGMYIIVFGLCFHVLLRRRKSGLGLYLICTVSLFVLATMYVASSTTGYAKQATVNFRASRTRNYGPLVKFLGRNTWKTVWATMSGFSNMSMNAIADIMLVHRCYVLWGSNKILLCFLASVAVVINGLGFATFVIECVAVSIPKLKPPTIFPTAKRIDIGLLIAIATFNGFLSLLTGVRIWWVSRQARQLMGSDVDARYKTIVAAILESGILYAAALIARTVISLALNPGVHGTIPIDLTPVVTMLSGLAPTLIIVRVAYGKSVESVQQMASIHFAERENRHGSVTSGLPTSVNICSHLRDEDMEADGEAVKDEGVSKDEMLRR